MASFSVPSPKVSPLLVASSHSTQKRHNVASFPRSDSRSLSALTLVNLQGHGQGQPDGLKVCAQLNDVAVDKLSNDNPSPITKSENQDEVPDEASISTFMAQVMDLVKLVDSKDIVELQLKEANCELHIRKKEALPQPPAAAPVAFAPPPAYPAMLPPQMPAAPTPAPAPSTPASTPTPAAPPKPKSSHPPFKSPMAGTFYRASSPGSPPFVKVGDKVQKGQVLCIIEAMKLMNEIEADHAGTIVDIVAEDGKPVSVEAPLFIIEP